MPSFVSDIDVKCLTLNITLCYINDALQRLLMNVMIRYVY